MIEENKIVTLDNNDQYLILGRETIDTTSFLIGIKIVENKYINDFKLFAETKKNEDVYLEEIQDQELIKTVVNSYILSNIN